MYLLVHLAICLHDAARQHAKCANLAVIALLGQIGIGRGEEPSEKHANAPLGATHAPCQHDVMTLLGSFIQPCDIFWSILQVAVHNDDPVTVAMIQAGADRGVLSEIAAKTPRRRGHSPSSKFVPGTSSWAAPLQIAGWLLCCWSAISPGRWS